MTGQLGVNPGGRDNWVKLAAFHSGKSNTLNHKRVHVLDLRQCPVTIEVCHVSLLEGQFSMSQPSQTYNFQWSYFLKARNQHFRNLLQR
jgi:hypothetical protein